MIDTLAIAKKMTAAGMPEPQAEAVAQTIAVTFEGEATTKREVKELEVALKREIKDVELNLKQVEASLKRDIKDIEASLKRDIKELELKSEKLLADSQRHTLQVGIAMALFVITALGFLFRFLAR
jgi:predicted phage-related endonuclease